MIPESVRRALETHVSKGAPAACWPVEGIKSRNKPGWHVLLKATVAGKRTTFVAHRVAYELAVGPVPEGLSVLHKCDNPVCCNPAHLFVGTQSDNASDMWNKKRGRAGDLRGYVFGPSPFRKLTPSDVADIIEEYKAGATQRHLADKHGVTDVTIGNYLRRSGAVSGMLGRGGNPNFRRAQDLMDELREMRALGITQKQCAEKLGCSQSNISSMERIIKNGASGS